MASKVASKAVNVFGLLLAFVALYYVGRSFVSGIQEAENFSSLLSFNPVFFAVSFIAVQLHLVAAAWSWQLVCRTAGSSINMQQAYAVHYLSQIGKYIPGKVWAAIGKVGLSRRIGMTGAKTGYALVLESIFIVAGCLLVTLPVVPEAAATLGLGTWAGLAAVIAGICLILLSAHPGVFGKLIRIAARVIGREVELANPGFTDVLKLLPVYLVVFLSLGFSFVLLAWSFGMEIPMISGMFIFPAAMGIGYLVVFTPGGLGVREISLVWLIELICPEVEPGLPELVAIASRLWITIAEGIAFIVALIFWKGKSNESVFRMLRRPAADGGEKQQVT